MTQKVREHSPGVPDAGHFVPLAVLREIPPKYDL
jgi:hypothetical protein